MSKIVQSREYIFLVHLINCFHLKPEISYICDKTLFRSSICNKCRCEHEQIFKEEESIEIVESIKVVGLINNIKEYQKIYNQFKNLDWKI